MSDDKETTNAPEVNNGESASNVAELATKKKIATKNKTSGKGAVKNDNSALKGRTEILRVDPLLLVVNAEENARMDYGNMKELESSIKARGVENPIRVKRNAEGKLEVVAGYRRTRACVNLNKKGHKVVSIPAILEKRGVSEKETLIHQYIENDGKPFTPIEEGIIFQRMLDSGMPLKEIVSTVGKTITTVKKRLEFLSCSKKLRDALQKNVINMRMATNIIALAKGDHEKEEQLLMRYEEALSTGDKKKVKDVRNNIHGDAGTPTSGMSAKHAKELLNEIAQHYTDFIRSKKPSSSLNVAWVKLDNDLKKVRAARRKGLFG